ncbi:unnamed protein product [Leptosia nina]|uniref:Secreted protein n=1 Tax=Leptosia nina TaxID=320188 RepID=A0AAV1K5I2_9NEOP
MSLTGLVVIVLSTAWRLRRCGRAKAPAAHSNTAPPMHAPAHHHPEMTIKQAYNSRSHSFNSWLEARGRRLRLVSVCRALPPITEITSPAGVTWPRGDPAHGIQTHRLREPKRADSV